MAKLIVEGNLLVLEKLLLSSDSKLMADVKSLYLSSFPANECIPYNLFLEGIERGLADCFAYKLEDEVVAFSYLLTSEQMTYLFFLAVSPVWQSHGIGTVILNDLHSNSQGSLLVTIEPLDQASANFSERLRRLRFYEQNGFEQTAYHYHEGSEVYQLLTSQSMSTYEALPTLVKRVLKEQIPVYLSDKSFSDNISNS